MKRATFFPSHRVRLIMAAAAMALLWVGSTRAQTHYGDPVEGLRKALKALETTLSTDDLTSLRALIVKRAEALRGPGDYRRALLLTEWQDENREPQVAAVHRPVRASIMKRLETSLKKAITSSDSTSREAAATMIGEIGTSIRSSSDPRGFASSMAAEVVTLSRDGNPRVQEAAAKALGAINADPKVAAPALGSLLQNPDVEVRRAAATGLGNLVQKLVDISQNSSHNKGKEPSDLESSSPEKLQAGAALVPEAAKGLVDADADVRRHSVEAIQITARALESDTTQFATDQVDVVRLIQALANQAPALANILDDPDPRVRILARRTLEDMASARQRRAPPKDGSSRGNLDRVSGPATDSKEPLLKVLRGNLSRVAAGVHDPNYRVRLATLDFLEIMAEEAAPAAPAVIGALSDPNLFVRWSAARTLGKMGPTVSAESVPALARLLDDKDLDVRATTTTVLETYGPVAKAAVPALARSVGKGDAEIRISALKALEAIGPSARSAIPAITHVLNHPNPRVRLNAAEVLGHFGPRARTAEAALRKILNDDDADVRRAASDALLNIIQ